MRPAEAPQRSGRETRLLLVTIAVSVGVLLLLARFRFPEQAQTAEPAPAPLERLAARAAYDELASTMADLERRIVPRVIVLAVRPQRPEGRYVVAPRVTPGRAVTVLGTGETLSPVGEVDAGILSRDLTRELAVIRVPSSDEALALPRAGALRPGPRYVVVVEGSGQGAILRPVYVGRTSALDEPRTGTPHLQLSALQHTIPSGAAIFSLDGMFIGVVREGGSTALVVPGEFLQEYAASAEPTSPRGVGTLGLDVQPLTSPLARAAGAEYGVMVTDVAPGAAAEIQPGDVIQAVDGTPVRTVPGYRQLEQSRAPGEPVALAIVRAGSEQQVTITAADAAAPVEATTEEHGIVGRAVPNVGIEVVAVQPGSAGARAGVQRGDLIVSVAGERPANLGQLTRTFRRAEAGDVLLVVVQRDERRQVLPLEKR